MNQESVKGIGGGHIRPSARKSIHSDCSDCQLLCRRGMGRYGLNNLTKKVEHNESTGNNEQGHDEVDNVMSKMSRPTSPVPLRSNNKYRRNSYEVTNECSDDDSDEDNLLSKSSPAAFSLSSDRIYASADAILLDNDGNNSNLSARSVQQLSLEHQRINSSINNLQNHSLQARNKQRRKEESACSWLHILLVLLCVICAAVAYRGYYYPNEQTKMNSIYDKISFYNDVRDLGEKYKVKDTSILQVRSGVSTIFEKEDTGSFIFAYNSKNNNFDPVKFNSFVDNIAATAARYLRNDSETVHHIVVDTVNLKMQTVKEFMNEYEDAVNKSGVMLVKDVDNVPSQLAMAFHYYCDEYSPLVKRSAIFFTLNLAKCSNNSDPKSTHEYIEKCLATKWNKVGKDKIGPLLTRVVNIVVDVMSIS